MGHKELLAEGWQAECLALVMPGGADLPYCRRLNGRGNEIIRGMKNHLQHSESIHACGAATQKAEMSLVMQWHKSMRVLSGSGYVEGGGAYIGLCAGAYYASSYVEFAIGTKCVSCTINC